MDAHTFDRLLAAAARRPSRRAMIGVVSAALLSVVAPSRAARADHSDIDGDQLWDEDEVDVYGTDPNDADTDNDNVSDGAEIWNRDQGLGGNTNPLVNENAAPPPPAIDPAPPPPAATCTGIGGPCAAHSGCCGYDTPNILCCFNANGAGTCTDVSVNSFLCPDPGVPTAGCPAGQLDCGGFCTDVMVDHGNCGFCGNRCSQMGSSYNCVAGACTTCSPGLTSCGGVCVDLLTDSRNCGSCGYDCGINEIGNSISGSKIPLGPNLCQGGFCMVPF